MSSLRTHPPAGAARRGERGQTVVEFALILPVFIILVAGIIRFGIALNYWLDLQRVANQGARWAVVDAYPGCPATSTPGAGCAASGAFQTYLANQRLAQGENTTPYICFPANTGSGSPATPAVGDPVTMRINRKFSLGIPFLPLGVDITGSATMRLEQVPTVFTADGAC